MVGIKISKKRKKKTKILNLSNITQKWVELLIPFSKNYHNKLSASELSRDSKIPQQTISRILNKIAGLNLINYLKNGKNKLFYFDMEKQSTKVILNLIENQKALQFQLNNKEINILINDILNYCDSLIIFGSYASGNFNKESDLDLVILGEHKKDQIKKIKQKSPLQINEHYISYGEFTNTLKLKNSLSIEIKQNHILFGNVSKIVNIFWKLK